MSCSSTHLDYKQRLFRSATRFQEEENAFREEAAILKNKIIKVGEHMHQQFGKVRERMVFMHELDKTMESDSSELLVKGKADSLTTGTVSSTSNSAQKESLVDETDQMAQRLIAHLTTLPREKRLPVAQKLLHDLGKLCAENEKAPAKDEGQKAQEPQLMNGETVPIDLMPGLAPRDSFAVAFEEATEQPIAQPIVTTPPTAQPTGALPV